MIRFYLDEKVFRQQGDREDTKLTNALVDGDKTLDLYLDPARTIVLDRSKGGRFYFACSNSLACIPRFPDGFLPMVDLVTAHEIFLSREPQQRGFYERNAAYAELELYSCARPGTGGEGFVFSYRLELTAQKKGIVSDTMIKEFIEDIRNLYFGIKEGKLEPTRPYEPKPPSRQ